MHDDVSTRPCVTRDACWFDIEATWETLAGSRAAVEIKPALIF